MTVSHTLARCMLAGAFLVCAAGAQAQAPAAPSAHEAPKAGAMASEVARLSKDDRATWTRCKQMTQDAMTADAKCKALLEAHPALAPQDKMMSTGKPKPPV